MLKNTHHTILVTGPIGSGKSLACEFFAAKGYPVYDCDSRTKGLYESIKELKPRIERELGISWSEIGIIFKDNEKREKLESIVYPYLVEDINNWKKAQDSPILFIESAIALDKAILDELYDEVLLIQAPLQKRSTRNPKVAERDGIQSYDLSKVNYIIDNDNSIEVFRNKLEYFIKKVF